MTESERVRRWVKSKAKKCPICGKSMYYKSSRCKNCVDNKQKSAKIKKLTIGFYRKKLKTSGTHPSWLHAEIRHFARSWNPELKNGPCQNCGYNKHVEICHKMPISSFPDSTTLDMVNSIDNLVALCPNCHWEFDHGLLLI